MNLLRAAPCDELAIRSGESGECRRRQRPWVLVTTILGSSMAFIDGSVVNVALPVMQQTLNTSMGVMQWVVNAYMLTLAALMLVGGAAGDRFGRRRVFMLGVTVFALASLACGLAPTPGALVAARALQGVGGALLVPTSLAIISAAFPESERGRAIGTWAGFSALTTALGPVLGGWLVDVVSWRAIFLINLPVAVAALLIAARQVPESRSEADDTELDWAGALLAMSGLAGITYGLIDAGEHGWQRAATIGSFLAGLLLLAGFFARESYARAPMLPLGLFRVRAFSAVNVLTLLLYGALSGAFFFLPFNLVQVQGYTSAAAGAVFLPATLVMGVLSRWSGGLLDRYGARRPLIAGPLIAAGGFALMSLLDANTSYWTTTLPATVFLGLGLAVSVAPLSTTVMNAVTAERAGIASGINNTVSRLATLIAVAVMGMLALEIFELGLFGRLDTVALSEQAMSAAEAATTQLTATELSPQLSEQEAGLLRTAIEGAFLGAYRVVMLGCAALAVAGALCAALFLPCEGQLT